MLEDCTPVLLCQQENLDLAGEDEGVFLVSIESKSLLKYIKIKHPRALYALMVLLVGKPLNIYLYCIHVIVTQRKRRKFCPLFDG